MTIQQQSSVDAVKALAITQRDWYIAQARIAMKAARAIEREYALPPADSMTPRTK